MKIACFKVLIFAVLFLGLEVSARPNRVKRVSDQRMAELETLIALSKMQGKLVTVPLAFGKLNPNHLGRRRRSQQAMLLDRILNRSEEDPEEESKEEPLTPQDLQELYNNNIF